MTRRNTRELILETSLLLFNELGEPNVSTNHIADEADISPGNLYYHFRSKDDIVLELFKRFLARFMPLLETSASQQINAEDLWFILHLTFELKGEFRFLYRNLSDLTSRIPDLDRAMRGLLSREKLAIIELLDGLEAEGSLVITPSEKSLLVDNILLVITYWIPFADIFDQNALDEGTAPVESVARVLQMLIPYLRKAEREQFAGLLKVYLNI